MDKICQSKETSNFKDAIKTFLNLSDEEICLNEDSVTITIELIDVTISNDDIQDIIIIAEQHGLIYDTHQQSDDSVFFYFGK